MSIEHTLPDHSTANLPYWCSESTLTNSYITAACPHQADALRGTLDGAAKLFRVATDAFVDYTQENPLKLDRLHFTSYDAWESLACQVRNNYRKAHFRLINEDTEYRTELGKLYDEYNAISFHAKPKPHEREGNRQRRYRSEVHKMVVEATDEGIPTSMAAYAVVPPTVMLRRPELDATQQLTVSGSLMPAANELSRHLARHSKIGNERLLRGIGSVPVNGHINYARLHYNPDLFDINFDEAREKYTLHTVGDFREPGDLTARFRGCPALLYGSVGQINKLIEGTIIEHDLYTRSIPGAN
jgi:hypothetical protein